MAHAAPRIVSRVVPMTAGIVALGSRIVLVSVGFGFGVFCVVAFGGIVIVLDFAVDVAARPPVAAVTPDCVDIVCIIIPSLFHLSSHQPPVLYCLIRRNEKMASKSPKICTEFFT